MTSQCIKSTVIQQSNERTPRKVLQDATIEWMDDEMTPEVRATREQWSSREMLHVGKICNKFSKRSPCACAETLTNAKVEKDGVEVLLEYPEYECNEQENRKRFEVHNLFIARGNELAHFAEACYFLYMILFHWEILQFFHGCIVIPSFSRSR